MAFTDSKPSSAELCGVGIDYTEDNLTFIQQLLEQFTVHLVSSAPVAGWQDTDPTNIYFSGPVLPLATSPGASSIYYEGAQYWNTTTKKLYGYDQTGATWVEIGLKIALPATSTDNAIVRWDGDTGATIQSSSASVDDSGNVYAPNIINAAKGQVMSAVENIVTSASIVGVWFFDQSTTATQLADRCSASGHTVASLCLRASSTLNSITAAECYPGTVGVSRYISITGASTFDTPDTAAFSFGDGATDSAFSIVALISPTFSAGGYDPIFAKWDDGGDLEWLFAGDATPNLVGAVYDQTNGAVLSSTDTGLDLTGDNAAWHVYVMTYDGGGVAAGIKLYRDGTQIDDTYVNGAGYVAMSNHTALPAAYHTSAGVRAYMVGQYGFLMVVQQEISTSNVMVLSNLLRAYAGVEI